ncbi:hypothetical protein ACFLZ6_00120 [Nanoarchaeota archaeon]
MISDSQSIVMDEGTELLSREAFNVTNRILTKSFFIQRALKCFVIICVPNFHMLDSVVRHHRVRTLLEVIDRGKYKAITGEGIKKIAKEGAATKDVSRISLRNGQFWHGYFAKEFPRTLNRFDYEKKKMFDIQQTIEQMKDDAIQRKMIAACKAAKEIGCKSDTVIKQIKNKQLEGKMIGNKWYLTRQAYDKLLSV